MATDQASANTARGSNDRFKRWLKLGAAILVLLGVLVTAIMLGVEHRQKKVASVSITPPSEDVTTESVPAVTATKNEVIKAPATTMSTPAQSVKTPPAKATADSSSSSDEGFFGLQPPGVIPTISETILGGAAVLAQAAGNSLEDACRVANAVELEDAITTKTCSVVILTSSERMAYILTTEIVISRPVVVMGNSFLLPFIDCSDVVRGFRVVPGGYLDLQFVRINIGLGVARPRWGLFRKQKTRRNLQGEEVVLDEEEDDWREPETEDEHRTLRTLQLGGQDAEANPGEVIDIRGGSVYFEPGAVGGTFNGVYFTSDQTSWDDIQAAIRLTVNLIGLRIWGGHVLVAGGDVSFNGCIFYDLELLTPFSDRIYFGGDVCVLAGMVRFTGCSWFYITLLGAENGMGFNTVVFGGVAVFTMCAFQEFNAAAAFNGAGQAFLVVGGVQIITGCSFSYFSATQFFAGTGEMTVLAGVQIVTGVAWQEWYGVFAYFGAGLDYCVGAGVLVLTGATLNAWSGPIWGSVAGDYFFVGAGSFSAHGAPIADYSSIGGVTGSGCLGYVATGIAVMIGAPIVDVSGIWTTFAIGEYIGVSSGLLVMIGCPFVEISAIEYFKGLGGALYVGIGGAVLGYSSHTEIIALVNEHFDFWIAGSCEPEHAAWAPGSPFFVPPGMGCEDHEHGDEDDHHDDHDHHNETRSRTRRRQQAVVSSTLGSDPAAVRGLLQSFASGDISLLAFNMTKKRVNVADSAQLQSLADTFPQGVADAAQAFLKLSSDSSPSNKTMMYINGAREGYCGLCNVDSVSGPGLSSCDQTKACGEIQTRLSSPGGLVVQDTEVFEDYKEHYVILADLDVTMPGVSGGLSETTVKEAMATLLAENGDALETLHVTVSDTTPDSLLKATFADGLPAEHEKRRLAFHRAMATETHDLTQRFKIMVVATSRERSNSVLNMLKPSSASVASPLQDDLKTYLNDDEGVDVGTLQLLYDRMLYIPAYNTNGLLDNDQNFPGGQTSAMGAFSVALQDPAQPAVPVNHAHYGSDNKYRLILAHFPPSASVSLRLVRVGGGVVGQEASWPLATVSVDENGAGETAVTFQPLIHREGDYYIKATEVASGIYNFSPVFTVEKGARRRKLYGPSMYV